MMQYPSFEDLAKVIRDSARLRKDKRIDPDTQVCRDLGISGDVGINILKAIECHYQIGLSADIFERIGCSIPPNDRDEPPVIQSLLGGPMSEEHPITVGQLYKVVLQELHGIPERSQVDRRAI
jgi:hypothetical protein